ncbi:MAG TPA: THUMP domain-containing protein [Gammaproteobacteria bacterium]|nr:THUMP domain-containing protein [Gammaproteobacteria bacterium]
MPSYGRHKRTEARYRFFATAAKGLEPIVANELRALGAAGVKEERGGASFEGSPATAYRACLWLRAANRVLYPIARFKAADDTSLYDGIRKLPWENDLSPDGSLAVQFSGTTAGITHTQFGAQRVKDAVVDRFRERFGRRPDVDRERPDLLINCHVHRDVAIVSIDLSGESLHMRGYRAESVAAPLKETLAAALLLKCGWADIAKRGGSFVDPLCGSGTLAIEAALIAGDIAPGLWRHRWGFSRWLRHDAETWETILREAQRSKTDGMKKIPVILGFDRDAKAVDTAQNNARAIGLGAATQFRSVALESNRLPPRLHPGLVVTNPPYGERLGDADKLGTLYAALGNWLKNQCLGWHAGVITSNPELGRQIGLRARKINTFYNGALECKLLQFDVTPDWFMREKSAAT